MAAMDLDTFFGWLVPDISAARAAAAELRRDYPDVAPERLALKAVARARKQAAAAGATTGIFANPLTAIPAALADMTAILKIEGTMVGTVAALLDPAVLMDEQKFRADVLGICFPGVASQTLRALGVRSAKEFTKDMIRRNVGKEALGEGFRMSLKYLGLRVTRDALLEKAVPIVGIGIGGGWNWVQVNVQGKRAINYYLGRPIGPTGVVERSKSVLSKVSDALHLPFGGSDKQADEGADQSAEPAA